MIRRPPISTHTDTLFPTRRSSDLITLAVRVVVLTEIRVAGDDGHEFYLPRGGEQRIVINHRQNALRHHHDIRRGTVQIGAQLIVENRNALAVVRKLLGGHIREVHHLLFPFQMKPKAFAPSASAEWRAGSGNVAMRAGDGGGGSPA